ncbi:MAG: PilZ domain-containing protein [Pseudobdellovibrionaceae bacterium]
MEEKKWFILTDGQVSGPFTMTEANTKLSSGLNSPLFWWRGASEWVVADAWRKEAKAQAEIQKENLTKERFWRLRNGDEDLEPMNHMKMIEYLKSLKDLSNIMIWTEGYSEWKEVYHIHKIMDELGVSRRAHPRVPIQANVTYDLSHGPATSEAVTISEGGMGLKNAPGLSIGARVKASLVSSQIPIPVHASIEVLYQEPSGYTGVRFIGLHTEAKSAIIEYVKKFNNAAR